jgi:hypothetical protein
VSDDFYVGYDTRVPASARPIVRGAVVLAIVVELAVAAAILSGERPFATSNFAFGTTESFSGRVHLTPYPTLRLTAPDAGTGAVVALVVAPGKHGAEPLLREFDGRSVTLSGTRITRDGQLAIEVLPGSIFTSTRRDREESLSIDADLTTVRGEIVDGKCYLGVMNPGQGATHRDCAVQCIRGGLPPLLAAKTNHGRIIVYTLAMSDGGPINGAVASFVGRRVDVTGHVARADGELLLFADAAAIRSVK